MNKLNELSNKLLSQGIINEQIYKSIKSLVLNKNPTEAIYCRLLELDMKHIKIVTETKISILKIILQIN